MNLPSPYAALLERLPITQESRQLNGSTTAIWRYGTADSAHFVVAVHGFRGDHHGLEPIIAQWGDVEVYSPDLPGFGESTPMAAKHTIEAYADWLIELTEQLRTEGLLRGRELVVLGHSFGSIVVSAAAARGLNADKIVLINPIAVPALAGPRGLLTRLAIFYYWACAKLPEKLGFALLSNRIIVRIMSVAMAKTKDRSLRAWIHNQHDRYFSSFTSRTVLLEAFNASVSHHVSEYSASLTVPTLLVAAERDDITAVGEQYVLRDAIADAQLLVIDDVGHLIHYETPQPAAAAISEFLAR